MLALIICIGSLRPFNEISNYGLVNNFLNRPSREKALVLDLQS